MFCCPKLLKYFVVLNYHTVGANDKQHCWDKLFLEDNCENINIIAPTGGPYGKVNSNSKYPLGGISARSVQIRYNFVEPIWKKSYLGFLTFTKFMCGADFITAINDGRVSFDVLDKTAAYDSVKQFNHLTKTGVTIQF